MAAKLQKNSVSMKFFPKKFARFKNLPYLCTRKSEMTSKPASVAQLVRAPDC